MWLEKDLHYFVAPDAYAWKVVIFSRVFFIFSVITARTSTKLCYMFGSESHFKMVVQNWCPSR